MARYSAAMSRKRLLLVYGGHAGGRTEQLRQAVELGALEFEQEVELLVLAALQAGATELTSCHGLLIGTPEHFGYMSGAVKDFFDRTFYPTEGRLEGLPYALFVSAGNDGAGAVTSVERIAVGYRWKRIAAPLVVRGAPGEADLTRCRELGQTMAAGLAAGVL
jgi:multimeric flavodoxin WrbA